MRNIEGSLSNWFLCWKMLTNTTWMRGIWGTINTFTYNWLFSDSTIKIEWLNTRWAWTVRRWVLSCNNGMTLHLNQGITINWTLLSVYWRVRSCNLVIFLLIINQLLLLLNLVLRTSLSLHIVTRWLFNQIVWWLLSIRLIIINWWLKLISHSYPTIAWTN